MKDKVFEDLCFDTSEAIRIDAVDDNSETKVLLDGFEREECPAVSERVREHATLIISRGFDQDDRPV